MDEEQIEYPIYIDKNYDRLVVESLECLKDHTVDEEKIERVGRLLHALYLNRPPEWGEVKDVHKTSPVRLAVEWFASQMEKKLRDNDNKPGWSDEPRDYFTARIMDELNELTYTLHRNPNNRDAAIKECVDIANFAMMLADNLEQGQV